MDNNDDKVLFCKCVYGIYLKYFFIEINLFVIFKINNYMINLEINISRFWCYLLLIMWLGYCC